MENFGEIFKALRESRNLTQNQVVGEEFTSAALSMFESGKSDITLSKFFYILKRIGVSLEEFEYIANNYDFNSFYKLLNKANIAYNENDEYALKKLLEKEKEKSNDIYQEMNCLMLKSLICELDSHYRLSDKEKDKISSYIILIDDWSYYQLILYNNTIRTFNANMINTLSSELLKRSLYYKSIPRNKKLIKEILINTIIVLIDKKEIKYANYFKNALEELLTDETAIYEKTIFLFVTGALDFHQGDEIEGKRKMKDAIDILNKVESYRLAKSYQQNYDEIVEFA